MFFHGSNSDLAASIEAFGSGLAVFEFSPEKHTFTLISCNELYADMLGRPKSSLLNQTLSGVFPRYVQEHLDNTFVQCRSEQAPLEADIMIEYKGKEQYWRSMLVPVTELKNGRLRVVQVCVDITEKNRQQRALLKQMHRYEAVVYSAYDGIITIDEEQKITLMNKSANQIFGYAKDEVIGQPLTKLLPQKYRKNHGGYVEGFRQSHVKSRPMETRASVRGLRKDGSEFPIEVTISKIDVDGHTEITAVFRDISEKNKLMEELLIASREDPLTRLYNRRHFTELLSNEIKRHQRFGRGFSLLMLDIDHFKVINDSYGHKCGDATLVEFATVLRRLLRDVDIIGRWGGEEFLVLLPETALDDGIEVAQKIRRTFEKRSFKYNAKDIRFTLSIGVQFVDGDGTPLDTLINNVDRCLYVAKSEGRNRVSSRFD